MLFGITQELFLPPIVGMESCMEINEIPLYIAAALLLAVWWVINDGED